MAGLADAIRETSLETERNEVGAAVTDGHGRQEAIPGGVDVVAMPVQVADADVFQVSVAVVAALAVGTATVVADFTNTQTCDFVCLREMLSARRLADANFISLRLVVPGALRLIFELADLDVLPAYATLSEALTGRPESRPRQGP